MSDVSTASTHRCRRLGERDGLRALMKPRVMSLVVFTALAGLVAAPGDMHSVPAAVAILAVALGAGAAGALNMWYDADIDRLMARTATRPVPAGLVARRSARPSASSCRLCR